MNSQENASQTLRAALQEIVVAYPHRGEHFESGFSEGCSLVSDIEKTIKRMDEGLSVGETLRELAQEHSPIYSDGVDRYGYVPVRSATAKAGLLEQFDEAAKDFRLSPPKPSPGIGTRLRSAFSRR